MMSRFEFSCKKENESTLKESSNPMKSKNFMKKCVKIKDFNPVRLGGRKQ